MKSRTLCRCGLLPVVLLITLNAFAGKTSSLALLFFPGNQTDTVPSNNNTVEPGLFQKAEIDASFPGGEGKWLQFLSQNLNGDVPVRRNAPEGKYTVLVQFIVDKEGRISDMKALTSHGYGMEEEVFRILRMSPAWKPAMIAGKAVKAYRKQPVTFMVRLDKKSKNS